MPRPKPYTKPGARLTAAGRRDLSRMIATTRDGRDITRPWISGLREPRDPRLLGAVDWGIYDKILMDDQVMSTLQQRYLAVISYPWNVLAGDEDDPRSVAAAEQFKKTMNAVGVDNLTKKMLAANFYGISVAELLWQPTDGAIFDITKFKVRHARRFRFDDDQKLRLLTMSSPQGELLSDRKFWVMRSGGTDDDEDYGRGLAEWLYWPTLFKRNGIGFWNIFLDKFGSPTAKGTYRPGTPQGDIEKLLAALQSMATDSGFVVPEGMAIELLEAARSGTADYEKLCRYMDEAIAKVVLSQTMTTQDGASLSQAQVHAGVKLEVVKADADLLSDSFNDGPARWWTDWNYGPDVASPRLVREIEEEADLKAMAETDKTLGEVGWERTDESFKATYGEGYQRKSTAETPSKTDPAAPDGGDKGDKDETGEDAPDDTDPPASFAAPDDPAEIDALVDAMIASDGFTAVQQMGSPLLARLAEANSEDEVRAILNEGLTLLNDAAFAKSLEGAAFALALDEAHREAGS